MRNSGVPLHSLHGYTILGVDDGYIHSWGIPKTETITKSLIVVVPEISQGHTFVGVLWLLRPGLFGSCDLRGFLPM